MSVLDLWRLILRFEVAALVVGALALLFALRSARVWAVGLSANAEGIGIRWVMAAWVLWGIVLTLRTARTPAMWLVLQPPVFLTAALAIEHCKAAAPPIGVMPSRPVAIGLLLLLLAQFGGGAVMIASGRDRGAFHPYDEQTEPAVTALAADLVTLRLQAPTFRPPMRLDIVAPRGADPLLAWNLRQQRAVHWVRARPFFRGAERHFVVAAADEPQARNLVSVYPIRRRGGTLQRVALYQER
jgi:hypothetical protein